ncbi:MAG: HD domain-containing phosphohydrolase [Terracidiphilus sp.]|jgi:putative nucleotidyltransferase with HDIG domain
MAPGLPKDIRVIPPSRSNERIALSEVISALSFALDLTEDAVPGHAIRSCLLGMRIGAALGLTDAQLGDLYYALLLKDVGCSSNAARMCQILGGDDRSAKRRVKTVDWTRVTLQGLRLAWRNALPGAGPWRKVMRVIELGLHRERNNGEMISLRCERGANIVRKIGLGEGCAAAIHSLDEHWNGGGYPDHLRGAQTPLLARIVGVAQHLDVFAIEESREQAITTLVQRCNIWFDPELVQIAVSLHATGDLFSACGTPDDRARAMQMEPGTAHVIGAEEVDLICEAFADVVDAKSPFTYRHSLGVTTVAVKLAEQLGLGPERCQLVRRAALLHDLGKLSLSNAILDKPAKLNKAEWDAVRKHPEISQQILQRIPSFAAIAAIAGRHHERLDGSGYHRRLQAADLSLEDRIVAMADVYTALSEDRPYRSGLAPERIVAIIREEVPRKLDPDCFEALKTVLALEDGAQLRDASPAHLN